MAGKGYIIWYADLDRLDLNDPWLKRWWIQQVLIHGRIEDISQLDFSEVRRNLPFFHLRKEIRSLWEDYFNHKS